jgi:hypothetical protein
MEKPLNIQYVLIWFQLTTIGFLLSKNFCTTAEASLMSTENFISIEELQYQDHLLQHG